MRIASLPVVLALAASVFAQDLAGDLTLHRLLIEGESWTSVVEGLGFADGPCADAEGAFYFSDVKANAIYKVALDGVKTKIMEEGASGLKFGPDGRLYACQGSKKRLIAITLANASVEILAEDVQPNDLVVTHRGHVYFTETAKKQVTFLDVTSKARQAVDTGIGAPNGLTLSPDQGTLAVSDYRGAHVWTFRIEPDGRLNAKAPTMTMRLPIDIAGEFKFNDGPPLKKESGGDGMASDMLGRYYVASALGVQVFDLTGRLCGILAKPFPDKSLTSCVLAGAKHEYLYVTGGDRIFRRKVQAVGNLFFQPPK